VQQNAIINKSLESDIKAQMGYKNLHTEHSKTKPSSMLNQSINQSKHISIAPYVASESEAQQYYKPGGDSSLENLVA